MPETGWKQGFFERVEPIAMRDPLASVLGATEEDEPIYYEYTDCVKLAGHACASVSSAFQMTKLALKALYGGELPVRGEIEVRFAGARDQGANGPIGQVIQFITGAAIETGFHGLAGRYSRADKFIYDESMDSGGAITAVFKRTDTADEVTARAMPGAIPMTPEEMEGTRQMPKVIEGTASREESESFFKYWQGKNRKILLEEHPEAFQVERS
ncbi:MAG: hypothetical protein ACNS63_00865 [Candidatus Nitrospinota bacterium M3_3B_026]